MNEFSACSNKRFLFITDHLGGGGAPISILDLARALIGQGCNVTIVVLSDDIIRHDTEAMTVHAIPFRYRNFWQKLHRYRLHAKKLDQWVDKDSQHFDLVIANLHYSHQVVNRSSLAEQAWLCIRTDPVAAFFGHKRPSHRKLRKLSRLYHGRRVIAISQGILDSLQQYEVAPREAHLIYNVIDATSIQQLMLQQVEFEKYIVYVGRLDRRQKRYDVLLKAYQVSGVAHPLVIVGDGEQDQAKALAHTLGLADKVKFIGKQVNPYPYIHHADLLLLSSDYEGFGRVIAEALVCGTPVVSTDCPSGPREILKGGLQTCLVPMGDPCLFGRRIADKLREPPVITPDHYQAFLPDVVASQYIELTK